jgi:hypothetical protein
MSVVFNDVERLILERWTEVMGLIDAHETLQKRISWRWGQACVLCYVRALC